MRTLPAALALAFAATLGCAVPRAAEEVLVAEPSLPARGVPCPAVAASCPAGCYAVGASPVDLRNHCVQDWQMFGCSSNPNPGPPSLACSVTPDGTMWVSYETRLHPEGRRCNTEEMEAYHYPRCS